MIDTSSTISTAKYSDPLTEDLINFVCNVSEEDAVANIPIIIRAYEEGKSNRTRVKELIRGLFL